MESSLEVYDIGHQGIARKHLIEFAFYHIARDNADSQLLLPVMVSSVSLACQS